MKPVRLVFITFLVLFPLQQALAIKTITREYPIPEHGELILNVPEDWQVTYYEPADHPSPIIIFYPLEKPHRFQLTVSALWDDGIERNVTDPGEIKLYIEEIGQDVLRYSDEDELLLKPLQGRMGQGYYFDLSDTSASSDEFKYLRQGAIGVGELLVVFSFFTNQTDDELKNTVIEMMLQAIQKHQRDVHFIK